MSIDPRTPVLVGVGQSAERIDDADYARLSAVELAAAAAGSAIDDACGTGVAAAIDTVVGVPQFEVSIPGATAPLGRSDNYPRSVARRLGFDPARAVLEVGGGQSPQHLVTEFAGAIARGDARVVLLVGSEAISTARHLAGTDDAPDFTEHVEGSLTDRGAQMTGIRTPYNAAHGLVGPVNSYALFENARRARLGSSRAEYAAGMGELFAPFTRVAAQNPYAAAPHERSAVELTTPTARNRPIADPYLRYLVSRDQVNQGAAVLLTSVEAARELGVPQQKWVFLPGHADVAERALLERSDLSVSPAAVLAAEHALALAGIGADELATIDLYSCFPVAVTNISDALGIAPDDPRGLTLTGGLPFFGGAGNNYSMHAIAETVHRARSAPGSFGFVGANGGVLSKYSVGVYSTTPVEWQADDSAGLAAQIAAWPAPPLTPQVDGWARIETYTVKHDPGGEQTGIVVGRASDGGRFLAMTEPGDTGTLEQLGTGEPIGQRIEVRATPEGNRLG